MYVVVVYVDEREIFRRVGRCCFGRYLTDCLSVCLKQELADWGVVLFSTGLLSHRQ